MSKENNETKSDTKAPEDKNVKHETRKTVPCADEALRKGTE